MCLVALFQRSDCLVPYFFKLNTEHLFLTTKLKPVLQSTPSERFADLRFTALFFRNFTQTMIKDCLLPINIVQLEKKDSLLPNITA